MLGLRSPSVALALLGACLGACFTDSGAPALPTGPSDADASMGPTTADPGSSTGTSTTGSTGEATTTTSTTTTTTTTTATSATSTGCVPLEWFFDIDKDGYGGQMSTEKCEAPGPDYYLDSRDCDDANPKINPDAIEVCDSVDNDCDGGIDEYPANAMQACDGCTAVPGLNSSYYLCVPERTWDEARTKCKTLLGDLISINDADENSFMVMTIKDMGLRWWIGLSDSASENQFVWVDNSPLDPEVAHWSLDEPDNVDNNNASPANCVTLHPLLNTWRDQSCMNAESFICEAPLSF